MADALNVAVVGASTLLGEGILDLLGARDFPVASMRLLGTTRSAGTEVEHGGRSEKIGLLGSGSFDGVDLVFFATGQRVSGEHVADAVSAGAMVVDLSSRFRLDSSVPLVVAEVNADALGDVRERGMVACPSANTIALAMVLKPLATAAGLRRVVVSTYQSAAGAGRQTLRRLSDETLHLLRNRDVPEIGRLAFNCVPQIGALEPGGPTVHELAVAAEVRKVLDDSGLAMSVTAVRVPVFFGHGLSVALETDTPLGAAEAVELLRATPGIELHDVPPSPAEIVGSEPVHVGRIRNDPAIEQGLMLWIALDNVLRGGALNAVAIAELLARDHL